jgi:hypothetical protein
VEELRSGVQCTSVTVSWKWTTQACSQPQFSLYCSIRYLVRSNVATAPTLLDLRGRTPVDFYFYLAGCRGKYTHPRETAS